MVQSARCLSCKHGDLRLDSQHHINSQVWGRVPVVPALERWSQGFLDHDDWNLANSVSSRCTERACLKNKVYSVEKDTQCQPLATRYMCTCMHMHTHTHTLCTHKVKLQYMLAVAIVLEARDGTWEFIHGRQALYL